MAKKKRAEKPPEKPIWEIDWDAIKTFNDLLETAIPKLKLILESNVGNRDEDIADITGDSADNPSDCELD